MWKRLSCIICVHCLKLHVIANKVLITCHPCLIISKRRMDVFITHQLSNGKHLRLRNTFSRVVTLLFSFFPPFSVGVKHNPTALRRAKTLWSFGRSKCSRVKLTNISKEQISSFKWRSLLVRLSCSRSQKLYFLNINGRKTRKRI